MRPLEQLGRAFQEGSTATGSCLASLLLQCDVAILTMLLTITAAAAITYSCYSCSSLMMSKSRRARKEHVEEKEAAVARNGGGSGDGGDVHSLPSPPPLLPRWLGFIGGHTLQIAREEVRD